MTGTPRVPELRPGLHCGTALAAARELRLTAHDGELVLHLPGGSSRVLVPAGAGARALLLTPEQEERLLGDGQPSWGALAVTVDGRPRALVRLSQFGPPLPVGKPDEVLWASGAVALASALEAPVEPATDADVSGWSRRDVAAALVDPVPAPPAPGRWTSPLLWLAGFVTFLTYPVAGDDASLVPAVLGLLLAAPAVLAQVRFRRRGHAGLVAPAPTVPGAVEVAPVAAFPVPRWFARSRLYVGPDVVVVRLNSQECWLPGPARGGAASVQVARGGARLVDGGQRCLAVLPAAQWYATPEAEQALVDAFTSAGVRVDVVATGELSDEAVQRLRLDDVGMLHLPGRERGDISRGSGWFSLVVCAMLLVASVSVAAWRPVAGAVHLVAVLALAVPLAASAFTQSRLFRRQRRLET